MRAPRQAGDSPPGHRGPVYARFSSTARCSGGLLLCAREICEWRSRNLRPSRGRKRGRPNRPAWKSLPGGLDFLGVAWIPSSQTSFLNGLWGPKRKNLLIARHRRRRPERPPWKSLPNGLDSLGLPWIPPSETSVLNGLSSPKGKIFSSRRPCRSVFAGPLPARSPGRTGR